MKVTLFYFPNFYFGGLGIPQRNMSFPVELHFLKRNIACNVRKSHGAQHSPWNSIDFFVSFFYQEKNEKNNVF